MFDIDWKPDRSDSAQLHMQIVGYIKGKLADGEWDIGSKLPSQRVLSEIFSVNRSTIVAALEELTAEGLIKGNAGGGTTVISNTWNLLSTTRPPDWNCYISSGAHQPNQSIMQQINQAEHRTDIINLGPCEPAPDLIPYDKIQKTLRKLSDSIKSLNYEEPRGSIGLRREICRYLKKTGVEAEPSSVLITSGALQALQLISLGLLYRNSVVYLEKPSYLYSLRTFQSFGIQLSGVPFDQDGINMIELLERHKRRKGSMLFSMPTFHNPTGNVMSLERRKELIKVCDSVRLPIIEDDVYQELWFEETPPPPLKAFDQNGLVLYIGGVSKNLSPGLRIGWIVGPEQVIERLADIKMQNDYGSSSISQYVAEELFTSGLYTEHNEFLRKNTRIRRDTALSALKKYCNGLGTWNVPSGGFFIWLKLNHDTSMNEIFYKALKRNLLIYPGNLYDFHSSRYIRISYSYASLEQIDIGIKILSEIISESLT